MMHATILHIQIPGHGVLKNINLATTADAAMRPITVGTFRVKKCVQENVLTNRPDNTRLFDSEVACSHLTPQNLCNSC